MKIKQIKPEDRKRRPANDPARLWNPNWINPRTESESKIWLLWNTEEVMNLKGSSSSWTADESRLGQKDIVKMIGPSLPSSKAQNEMPDDYYGEGFTQENMETSVRGDNTSPQQIELTEFKETTAVDDEQVQMIQAAKAKSVNVATDWTNRNRKAIQEPSMDDIGDRVGKLQILTSSDNDAKSNSSETIDGQKMNSVVRSVSDQSGGQDWEWERIFESVEKAAQQKAAILIDAESETSIISTKKVLSSKKKSSRFPEELESIEWVQWCSSESSKIQRLPDAFDKASNVSHVPSRTTSDVKEEPLIMLDTSPPLTRETSNQFDLFEDGGASVCSNSPKIPLYPPPGEGESDTFLINLDENIDTPLSVKGGMLNRSGRNSRLFDTNYDELFAIDRSQITDRKEQKKPLLFDLKDFDPLFLK